MLSKAKHFSRVYVERGVLEHPRTQRLLTRFSRSTVVEVDDYQNVFGRGGQDFWRQKASTQLIIAAKKEAFLYAGNAFQQLGLSPNFCYNACVLNCPYDCHYCYLQGLYGSANLVVFVNLEDFFGAAEERLRHRPDPAQPLELAISYDSDLLALEGLLGYVAEWTHWARGREGLRLEVRTKSAPVRFLREVEPTPQVRLSWTLSPASICERYESGAPGLEARLEAVCTAIERGWRVSLSLDPILKVPDSAAVYSEFVERLGCRLPTERIEWVEVGVFRVSPQHFKRMRRRPQTDLLHYPFEHDSTTVSYSEPEREELVRGVVSRLSNHFSTHSIYIWT
jgi:spore photoproduct lyase